MQLKNLTTTLSQMTDEQLLEKLRVVRTNREVIRAAVKKRTERVEKKASRGRVSATTKLLEGLSDDERQALIKQLQEGE